MNSEGNGFGYFNINHVDGISLQKAKGDINERNLIPP
jgi:hypothetical protein